MAFHHPPTPPARPVVREHREGARLSRPAVRPAVRPIVSTPVVRDHREPVRWDRDRAPVRYDRDRDHDRYRDRDDDRRRVLVEHPVYQTSVWTASPGYTYVPQPIQLMAPTALTSEALTLDVNLGGATTLQLSNTGSGSTYVSQILLVEPDGDTQAIPVNAILSPQNPTVQLPVGNSAGVSRIVVEGHSDWGGSLALTAV